MALWYPRVFCKRGFLWASVVSVSLQNWGRTVVHVLGFLGPSHMGSQLCVTDQGSIGGHAVGSGQSIGRRW